MRKARWFALLMVAMMATGLSGADKASKKASASQDGPTTFVYVSSWNQFLGKPGLGLYKFDARTGELDFVSMQNTELSCGFSFVDKKRGILYLANEVGKLPGTKAGGGGRIFAFKIDAKTGDLTELCNVATLCPNPCYFSMDATGKFLVVANHSDRASVTKVVKDATGKYRSVVEYDDAVIDVFPVAADGSIGEPVDVVKHVGKAVGLHSMPHTAVMSPSGKLFAVNDIGEDRIYMYGLDPATGALSLSAKPFDDVPGSSVRYGVFHPNLPFYYVNHEQSRDGMDVRGFRYDESGNLQPVCTVSVMPPGYAKGKDDEQQGFCFGSSGKYIYDAVVGPNEIVVLEVNEKTGALKVIQHQGVEGKWPRGLAVSPDGKFMLAACLASGDLLTYSIGDDGTLSPTGFKANQPAASYVTFYQP